MDEDQHCRLQQLAAHTLDGSEGDEIVNELMETVITARGDLTKTSAASKQAKRRLRSLLRGLVHIDAVVNFIGDD